MRTYKARVAAIVAAGSLSLGAAGTARAAPQQDGLVNLAVTNNVIQVPVGVAANICGVAANVLASGTSTSPVDCTATGMAGATATPRERGNTRQNGLVNVDLSDNTVQVPVGIAANVCGVTVNALELQRDLLEALEALDVCLERLPAGSRAGP